MKKLLIDRFPSHYMPGVGRQVMADGGEVEGDVSFLEETPQLPVFAQPETQAVTRALDAARRPEATMRAYEPTLREKVYGAVAGTDEARPSAERSSFAHGVADLLGLTPVFGQAMQAQEAVRAGDDKALAMSVLPGPAGRSGALTEDAATNIAKRVTNPLGMYSRAAEVARGLPQQQGTVEQMLAMIRKAPGVNPEELHWSDPMKAFQPGQKVTAEDLASHFDARLPQVKETIYGASNEYVPGKPVTEAFKYHERAIHDTVADDLATSIFEKPYSSLHPSERADIDDMVREHAVEMAQKGSIPIHEALAPKYALADYNKPHGLGENYREVVLHHDAGSPVIEKDGFFYLQKPDGSVVSNSNGVPRRFHSREEAEYEIPSWSNDLGVFNASHHNETPNVLGHLRLSDRVGPNGERILNVHEVQSDWGQQARSLGVAPDDMEAAKAALMQRREAAVARTKEVAEEIKAAYRPLLEGVHPDQVERAMSWASPLALAKQAGREDLHDAYNAAMEESAALWDELDNLNKSVPRAPYVTSREGSHNTPGWTDLLIKRVMQEAEKGGYDRVVFDSGAEQAHRWQGAPKAAKGMLGYYNDILPKRMAKVVPEAKLQQFPWGDAKAFEIKGDDATRWAMAHGGPELADELARFRMNSELMTTEAALRATGHYPAFMISQAEKHGIENPILRTAIMPNGEDGYNVYHYDDLIGSFPTRDEAVNAANTFAADKIRAEIDAKAASEFSSKPGFDVDDALRERIRKGFTAYKRGGEVEQAINVARLVGG